MYSCNVLDEQYAGAMAEHGFVPGAGQRRYGSMGLCWRQAGPGGSGYFWTYGQQDLYMLKIHDFYFHEDQLLEFCWPESLSVTWYESISGEEFSPCRRLVSGCVKSFIGGREPYRRSSTAGSPSYPSALRSLRLTIRTTSAASFRRSFKACWNPFNLWTRPTTSRRWSAC